MTTAYGDNPTLLDQMKARNPDGSMAKVAPLLMRKTPMFEDATFLEGNKPDGHLVTTQSGIPSVGWVRYNEGVDPSKQRRDQFTESIGMLAGRSEIDEKLLSLYGDGAAFRASEDLSFVGSMGKEADRALMYEDTTTSPEKIRGLAPRFNSTTAEGGSNIILCDSDAAGSDQTSVWLVCWSPETMFCVFPKGSQAGIHSKDRGLQQVTDANGRKFDAYVTAWELKVGLVVKDWRYVVRIANIDAAKVAAGTSPLLEAMNAALEQIEDLQSGRYAWYGNRAVATYLRNKQIEKVAQSTLTVEQLAGRPVLSYGGVPFRRSDSILSTEAVIS